MIVAGLAPAILGDLADNIGRRIVYLSMMAVYCIANIGLVLQTNWTALFLLRMLQSTGSAGMWLAPSEAHARKWMTPPLPQA
jgi:MFS family permease